MGELNSCGQNPHFAFGRTGMEQETSSTGLVVISNFRTAILIQTRKTMIPPRSAYLELQAEGPQHEGDIAKQGIEGMLPMTVFSREWCARSWRVYFGMRFAS